MNIGPIFVLFFSFYRVILYHLLDSNLQIIICDELRYCAWVEEIDADKDSDELNYVKITPMVHGEELERYYGNEVQNKMTFQVVHCYSLQVPDRHLLPFNLELDKEIENDIEEEKTLKAAHNDVAGGALLRLSKHDKRCVEVRTYQTADDVKKLLDRIHGILL